MSNEKSITQTLLEPQIDASKQAAANLKAKRDAVKAKNTSKTTTTSATSKTYYSDEVVSKVTSTNLTSKASDLAEAYKNYTNRLDEYDAAIAIARAKYSHEDVTRMQTLRHRFRPEGWRIRGHVYFGNALTRYEAARDKVQALESELKEFTINSATSWLPSFYKKSKQTGLTVKLAEAKNELTLAKDELSKAEEKLLANAYANKKAAFDEVKKNGAEQKTLDILESLQTIDQEILKLALKQVSHHEQALEEIEDWHREGGYKTEFTPFYIDLSPTPSHQKIYDIRKGAEKRAKDLQKDLREQGKKLNEQLQAIATRKQSAPALTPEESAALEKVEQHINSQIESLKSIFKVSKKSLKAEDAKANEYLKEKYKDPRFSDSTKTAGKHAGIATVGGAGLFLGNWAIGTYVTASLLSTAASGGLALIPIGLVLGWELGKRVMKYSKIGVSKIFYNDEFTDELGKQVIAARVGATGAYLAFVLDENGNKIGVTSGGGYLTEAERREQVCAFIEMMMSLGLEPGGTLRMTSIPEDHYEEYCNLLTEECKRLGIAIEFDDPVTKQKLTPDETKKRQEKYQQSLVGVQQYNREELEKFAELPENKGLSREQIEDKFRVHHLMRVASTSKVVTPLQVIKMIGNGASKDDDKDDDKTPTFGVAGFNPFI